MRCCEMLFFDSVRGVSGLGTFWMEGMMHPVSARDAMAAVRGIAFRARGIRSYPDTFKLLFWCKDNVII